MTNETQNARKRQPGELWTNYLVERLIGDFRNDRNNLYLPKVIPDDFEGSIDATEIIIDIPTRKGLISASQKYYIDFVRNAKEARKLFCPHPYEMISVTEGPISTTEEPKNYMVIFPSGTDDWSGDGWGNTGDLDSRLRNPKSIKKTVENIIQYAQRVGIISPQEFEQRSRNPEAYQKPSETKKPDHSIGMHLGLHLRY